MIVLLASSALALGLAGSADLVSTEIALRHGAAYEANPFMQSRAARVGVKAAMGATVYVISRKLEKRGKRGTAKALVWTTVGVWTGAAVWNLHQARKEQR